MIRSIILAFILLPFIAVAQKTDIFIKLVDASGKQINGDASLKGYERQIGVVTVSSAGKNNMQLLFTMPITGASADLKRSMASGEVLQSGILTVTKLDPAFGKPLIVYTIKMENIKVNACSETIGCNNMQNTATTLTATRIGWTYYQTNPNGTQSVSRKYGYDATTSLEWTNF
jgi:type VI protein secretion system component Hcp